MCVLNAVQATEILALFFDFHVNYFKRDYLLHHFYQLSIVDCFGSKVDPTSDFENFGLFYSSFLGFRGWSLAVIVIV